MSRDRKARLWFFLSALFATTLAWGTIHTWGAGETLTYTDLNGNFSDITGRMVGGAGARLVDADVSASANIALSKLAGTFLLPKNGALIGAGGVPCDGAAIADTVTCTLPQSVGVTSVKSGGTAGRYRVVLNPIPHVADFGVLATSYQLGSQICYVLVHQLAAPQLTLQCEVNGGGAVNAVLMFAVHDT